MTPLWLEPMDRWTEFRRLKEMVYKEDTGSVELVGLNQSQKCHMLASVLYPLERSCLYITSGDAEARRIQEDLLFFYPEKVMLFPEREVLLYNVAAQSTEITEQRLQVIEALLLKQNVIVVASIQAVLALQCPPQVFKDNIFTLKVGDIAPLEQLSEKLVRMGYERVSAVEGKGQFSVRGGILDVFPLTSDDPYRIEFLTMKWIPYGYLMYRLKDRWKKLRMQPFHRPGNWC